MLNRAVVLFACIALTACADPEPSPQPEAPAPPVATTGLSADEAAGTARTMGDAAPKFHPSQCHGW